MKADRQHKRQMETDRQAGRQTLDRNPLEDESKENVRDKLADRIQDDSKGILGNLTFNQHRKRCRNSVT